MKQITRILTIILALAMILPLASCNGEKTSDTGIATDAQTDTVTSADTDNSDTSTEKTDMSVVALKGPTGMGMAKLMEDYSDDYNFTIASAPDEISAGVIKGTYDIAAVPSNLAAVLYNKTEGAYILAAANTLGVLYMLETGNTVNSIEDLRGKTIYATGQGSTPEYILRYVLSKNNIDPDKDVTIEYKAEHSELTSLMATQENVIGMLPEPNVTTAMSKNANIRVALNMTEEWNKVDAESTVIQGCIIVKKEFAENHADQLKEFLTRYSDSVKYVNSNLDQASQIITKHGIVPSADIAKNALPRCNIVYIPAEECKDELNSFLNVLYEAKPASVGGKLPDDNFYYKAQN